MGRVIDDEDDWAGTGWIASNGALVTAQHVAQNGEVIEFNVPFSSLDGTIRHPSPGSQYVIAWSEGGVASHAGDDWNVFECFPNTNTGLTPAQAQWSQLGPHAPWSFFRLTGDVPTAPWTMTVSGYGRDSSPPENNNIHQFANGAFIREIGFDGYKVEIRTHTYSTNGVSGGPMSIEGTNVAIGILKGDCRETSPQPCDCTPPSPSTERESVGTGFGNTHLEAVLQTFPVHDEPWIEVVYVDEDLWQHIDGPYLGDGTVLRPFQTVSEAISSADPGARVSIVSGIYYDNLVIDQAARLEAPVGPVVINSY